MKLADLATGSDWIVWIVFVIFAVLSIVLLSGHGSWFISGYNTASKEEKKKYESNKALVLIAEKYDLIKKIKTDGERAKSYDYDYEKNKSKKGNKCKYIATCVEALIAAIYINTGNLDKLKELVRDWMEYIDKNNYYVVRREIKR